MPPARIVIAGGTGFLGRALSDALAAAGHDVVVLTRQAGPATNEPAAANRPHTGVRLAHWVPDGTPGPWAAFLEGASAVVNLAGESMASGRWTPSLKARVRDSRLDATRSLVAAIHGSRVPPAAFISASAVGYYGTQGDDVLTEESPPGSDFLAELCVEWEGTAQRAADAVRRVVLLRTGLVLDREAGALPRMLMPFRFFVGGPLGSGRQYVSWIHLADWVALVLWAAAEAAVSGPLNLTAPNPVTNAEFARTAGRVLRRPAVVPTPALALRLLLGEMADAVVLGGQRVVPQRALAEGFRFEYPDLDRALADVLLTSRQ